MNEQFGKQFELAAGSVTGSQHRLTGKNNQDAFYSLRTPSATIAVVCDGCGSGTHSEVGAKLGARLVVGAIAQLLARSDEPSPWSTEDFWQQVQQQVLNQLHPLADQMGGCTAQTIGEYFLFTIVGTLLTPTAAVVFSLGDGIMVVNGQVFQSGPFPNNAPPYLAYKLLNSSLSKIEIFQIQVQHHLPIDQVETILIGTDGVIDLMQFAEKNLPGKSEPVGPLKQFWQEERYFRNPDAIRRRLALINRATMQPNWQEHRLIKQSGLLQDDTTLVAIRRCKH